MVTYYVAGDTDLWKKGISSFHDSRLALGLTQSRYPCYKAQIIPTFSLIWITMCHDYVTHCDDPEFIKPMLPVVAEILQWCELRLDDNDLPGDLTHWQFIDWVTDDNWNIGMPPTDEGGHSAPIALLFVYALERAAALYEQYGQTDLPGHYRALAARVRKSVLDNCWDAERQLVADAPSKRTFSQHPNVLAVLTDLLPEDESRELLERTIENKEIAQYTYYFRFYLAEALKHAGMADCYIDELGPWRQMLEHGLTTFAEEPDPVRSDCHAWSSSPVYHFLSLVCGIEPASPGFKTVRIRPSLGPLKTVDARMPHPAGEIALKLQKMEQGAIEGEVTLPQGLEGVFEYQQTVTVLKSGTTRVAMPSGE